MTLPLAAVVLCAGQGKRMKSARAKVLHPVLGRPLCYYPLKRAFSVGASPVVAVVGHQAPQVESTLRELFVGDELQFALQREQRGTADAVRSAEALLQGFRGAVMVLYGDTPLLTEETLKRLWAAYQAGAVPLAMVTTELPDPKGYGRVVRVGGRVARVVEDRDADAEQRAIREVNAGIYVMDSEFLFRSLGEVEDGNAQGELYLTDLVEKAARSGPVATVAVDSLETAGVNDRAELAKVAQVLRQRINHAHMLNGVTLQDPGSTSIDEGVEIGPDSELGAHVSLMGKTRLGAGVRVGQGSVVLDASVAEGTEVKPYSLLEAAVVGPRCQIGPFARLRPGTELDEGVHLGNFVETKKARIGKGSKANHLSYLGDARIGAGVNVGAGTITCNYDGVDKHETVLEDGVFIGSDSQLVAPVTVQAGSYIGAGTTVTRDVPPMSLALSRAPQVVKEGWVASKKGRKARR